MARKSSGNLTKRLIYAITGTVIFLCLAFGVFLLVRDHYRTRGVERLAKALAAAQTVDEQADAMVELWAWAAEYECHFWIAASRADTGERLDLRRLHEVSTPVRVEVVFDRRPGFLLDAFWYRFSFVAQDPSEVSILLRSSPPQTHIMSWKL